MSAIAIAIGSGVEWSGADQRAHRVAARAARAAGAHRPAIAEQHTVRAGADARALLRVQRRALTCEHTMRRVLRVPHNTTQHNTTPGGTRTKCSTAASQPARYSQPHTRAGGHRRLTWTSHLCCAAPVDALITLR